MQHSKKKFQHFALTFYTVSQL